MPPRHVAKIKLSALCFRHPSRKSRYRTANEKQQVSATFTVGLCEKQVLVICEKQAKLRIRSRQLVEV